MAPHPPLRPAPSFRTALGFAALSGLLLSSHPTIATEFSYSELTPEQKLALSIRNEALTGSASTERAPDGVSQAAGRIAGIARSQSSSGNASELPKLHTLLPTVPVTLADGRVRGSLSPGSTALSYDGDQTRFNMDLGFGYYNPEYGKDSAMGKVGMATLIGKSVALGGSALFYADRYDLYLSTIWQPCQGGLRFRAAGSYLRGDQSFDFPSGAAKIGLEQYGWLGSMSWVPSGEEETGWLHTVGITLWGARANQTSTPEPVYFSTETASDWLIWRDPLKVAEGRLFGASADFQAALMQNLVAKGSLGYEQLEYPFMDGTKERDKSFYSNIGISWEPVQSVTVGADWKGGAGEQRYGLSLSSGHWKVESWYSQGMNGIDDDKGAMLTYSLAIPYGGGKKPLAERMRPTRSVNPSELLTEVQSRPSQLPSRFLAKVDRTAVEQVASISKLNLPADVKVDAEGNLTTPVGTGVLSINGVTRNGAAYTASGSIATAGNLIVIHTRQLPGGVATYVISATDSNGTAYTITMETE